MPEKLFRYVQCERATAWEAAGWSAISGPQELKPPAGLEGSSRAVQMILMEWTQAGQPVEPDRLGYPVFAD